MGIGGSAEVVSEPSPCCSPRPCFHRCISFANHRQVFSPLDIICDTLQHLHSPSLLSFRIGNVFRATPELTWGQLVKCLKTEGEQISDEDFNSYLTALIGGDVTSIPEDTALNATQIAEQILGFEDFDTFE